MLEGAPPEFAQWRLGPDSRAPAEILAQVGDLLDWALSLAHGQHRWRDSTPLPWDDERSRFFATLRSFDDILIAPAPLGSRLEVLFQGPIADALTHVGQLAMLRRLAGAAVRGENYAKAPIAAGSLGPEYPGARVEFD